jgi:hypothetical protein
MRKILIILLILPFLSFTQCRDITEEDLTGKSFMQKDNVDTYGLKFDNDGFFRIQGKSKATNMRWYIIDNILFYYYTENDIPKTLFYRFGTKQFRSTRKKSQIDKLLFLLNDENRKEKFYVNIKGLMYGDTEINFYSILAPVFDDYSDFFSKNIFSNTKECVEQYHINNYNKWIKKGEYEKSEDYKNRVTEISKKNKSESLMQESLRKHSKFAVKSFNNSKEKASEKIVIKDYNADNETFLIEIKNFEPINFPISISEAESFKNNFYPPKFSDLELHYLDGKFLVSKITINDYKYTLFAE